MKTPIVAAVVIAALGGSALAETRYDRNLEEAARAMAVSRMGALRGSLPHDAVIIQPEGVDTITTSSVVHTMTLVAGDPRQEFNPWLVPRKRVSRVIMR
jgi:hypothetical protein